MVRNSSVTVKLRGGPGREIGPATKTSEFHINPDVAKSIEETARHQRAQKLDELRVEKDAIQTGINSRLEESNRLVEVLRGVEASEASEERSEAIADLTDKLDTIFDERVELSAQLDDIDNQLSSIDISTPIGRIPSSLPPAPLPTGLPPSISKKISQIENRINGEPGELIKKLAKFIGVPHLTSKRDIREYIINSIEFGDDELADVVLTWFSEYGAVPPTTTPAGLFETPSGLFEEEF